MKPENLYEAMNGIDDELLEESEHYTGEKKKKPGYRRWSKILAACACLALIVAGGTFLLTNQRMGGSAPDGVNEMPGAAIGEGEAMKETAIADEAAQEKAALINEYALVRADIPEDVEFPLEENYVEKDGTFDSEAYDAAYDAWWDRYHGQEIDTDYVKEMKGYLKESIGQFLANPDKENVAYSPINVYMALGMLAEITEGSSRQQILDALQVDSIEQLQSITDRLWSGNYINDGIHVNQLAASLWLNKGLPYEEGILTTLAETYHASVFQGLMGDNAYDQALRNWLDESTGGMLTDQIGGISMDPDTVLALATTIYYKAKWIDTFSEAETAPQTFHGTNADQEMDFMHSSVIMEYYEGDGYTAIEKALDESGSMWFILPEKGTSLASLLEKDTAMDLILDGNCTNVSQKMVNLSVPKFDAQSQTDLTTGLKNMGITDVMDIGKADFSALLGDGKGVLSSATHGVRVTIDENGCTAAAYTMMLCGASAPMQMDEVDFTLDRPFLYVITGKDGLPLFVGSMVGE